MRQEARLTPWIRKEGFFFEDFRTHMSQSVEKYLDVVGTLLIVRLKSDDSYF